MKKIAVFWQTGTRASGLKTNLRFLGAGGISCEKQETSRTSAIKLCSSGHFPLQLHSPMEYYLSQLVFPCYLFNGNYFKFKWNLATLALFLSFTIQSCVDDCFVIKIHSFSLCRPLSSTGEMVCQKTKTPCLLFLEADSLGIWEFCYLGVDTEPLLERLGLFVTH